MNILKYLIAETINDNDNDDVTEKSAEHEVNHDSVADCVFEAFATFTASCAQIGSREKVVEKASLADSGIVFNEDMFVVDGLNIHLDTVH